MFSRGHLARLGLAFEPRVRVGEHAGGADGENGRDGPQDAEEEELVVSDIAVLIFDPGSCVLASLIPDAGDHLTLDPGCLL